jgi:multiple sugar transport system permease protein
MGKVQKRTLSTNERQKRLSFYIFISPWLLGLLLLWLFPIGWGFFVSLTNRTAFVQGKFVGLANYLKIFSDPDVGYAFYTTFLYTISSTFLAVVLGFIFALLLERNTPGRGGFRTILYFPYMIPLVAVGWIFRIFLNKDTGFFNIVLTNLGIIESPIAWLQMFPLLSIVSLSLWQSGWSMIIFLGGLSTVPEELYEVATIDGAGYLKKVRHITVPMISPFIFFQLVMSFIYAMQAFIQPFILNPRPIRGQMLTRYPPPKETFFIMAKGFYTVITKQRFAYGLAMLWLLFLFILIFTFFFVKFGGFWVYTEVEEKK